MGSPRSRSGFIVRFCMGAKVVEQIDFHTPPFSPPASPHLSNATRNSGNGRAWNRGVGGNGKMARYGATVKLRHCSQLVVCPPAVAEAVRPSACSPGASRSSVVTAEKGLATAAALPAGATSDQR